MTIFSLDHCQHIEYELVRIYSIQVTESCLPVILAKAYTIKNATVKCSNEVKDGPKTCMDNSSLPCKKP